MKEQLKDWGIKDATIVNASGLNNSYLGENRPEGTGENDENQMSAQDVAIVARHLILDFPEILDVSSTTTQMFGENTQSPVEMVNWNWMLPGFVNYKEGVDGLKLVRLNLQEPVSSVRSLKRSTNHHCRIECRRPCGKPKCPFQ